MSAELATHILMGTSGASESVMEVRRSLEVLIGAIHPWSWVYDMRRGEYLLSSHLKNAIGCASGPAPIPYAEWSSYLQAQDQDTEGANLKAPVDPPGAPLNAILRFRSSSGDAFSVHRMGARMGDMLPPNDGLAVGIDQIMRKRTGTSPAPVGPQTRALILGTTDHAGLVRTIFHAVGGDNPSMLGKHLSEMFEPSYRKRLLHVLNRVRTGGSMMSIDGRMAVDRSLALVTCTPILQNLLEPGPLLFAIQVFDPSFAIQIPPDAPSVVEETLMDQHPDLILRIHPSGVCTYANARARQVLGFEEIHDLLASVGVPATAARSGSAGTIRWVAPRRPSLRLNVKALQDTTSAVDQCVVLWCREEISAQETLAKTYRNISMVRFLAELSTKVIGSGKTKVGRMLDETLSVLGRFAMVDRTYIFEMRESGRFMDNTYEWCRAGVEPQKENLQNQPSNVFPWFMGKLERNELILLNDLSDLPPEAGEEHNILSAQEIKSLLVLPLYGERGLLGFIGFDAVVAAREWNEEDISLLRLGAKIVASAFEAWYHEAQMMDLNQGLEERVRTRTRELEQANKELHRASRAKDSFFATVSHELRTPLTSIMGFSDALQQEVYGQMTQKQRDAVRAIEVSSEHLLGLINEILDMAKAESGELRMECAPENLHEICDHVAALVQPLLSRKRLVLTIQRAPIVPRVNADGRRISQVLLNLLSNAVKFTPEGGTIAIGIATEDHRVEVSVADTGIGIAQDELDRIFEPFYQIPGDGQAEHQGTGLGLALARQLVELHGGMLQVRSMPGSGSTFSFTLPLISAAP